jgi:hypothetical protein
LALVVFPLADKLFILPHDVKTGKLEGGWNSFTVLVANTPEGREALRQWLDASEKILTHPTYFEETITLFGQAYALGRTKSIYLEGKLANEQEVREMVASQVESEIRLEFIPNGDSTFIKEYLDWITDTGETSLS